MQLVEQGKLDLEWLTRLEAIADLIEDIISSVALLLCLSVVLIIGNTIRLAILHQKEAIAIMKLVGATDSFIQRPFLYSGAWYGILGGLLASIAVAILAQYLSASIDTLANLYGTTFSLDGLTFSETLYLIAFAIILGLLGSYISVQQHIRGIEPKAD
jgi:cell division transport system permease protein